jgi:hypothetical protein
MSRGPLARVALAGAVCLVALGSGGAPQPPAARSLPPNAWVNMQAGGVAAGNGVGDEGYSTFVYSPGLRKAVVFGKYHARDLGGGEDQNALLAYDFGSNRWDVLEITEAAWSEFLPGVGHDQGLVAIDPRRDLYITRGNMTLHGNTGYQTYIFDLRAGRGKRMMPLQEPTLLTAVASGFDPDRGLMLITRGPSWLYDPDTNRWSEVSSNPSDRPAPSLVYDPGQHVFVMFGGGQSNETWIFETGSRRWRKRTPPVSPSPRASASMAFDSTNGVILLVGGFGPGETELRDMWVYDTGSDRWALLPITAPTQVISHSGNTLVYDSYHGVFLLKDITMIRNLWAFRYVPAAFNPPATR